MKPKEILEYYQRVGWDALKANLYERIGGSLSYLLNRKGTLKTKKDIDQAGAGRRKKPRSMHS